MRRGRWTSPLAVAVIEEAAREEGDLDDDPADSEESAEPAAGLTPTPLRFGSAIVEPAILPGDCGVRP